jgi:hypothetical protein
MRARKVKWPATTKLLGAGVGVRIGEQSSFGKTKLCRVEGDLFPTNSEFHLEKLRTRMRSSSTQLYFAPKCYGFSVFGNSGLGEVRKVRESVTNLTSNMKPGLPFLILEANADTIIFLHKILDFIVSG